ncbi:6-phosphogluconolactonase [Synechococcus sp. RSCCF101]|uniref:6-phosphogluconolactonase n=1 Tax=Synechococcus sp. RSCCF101 TaxID=2511069 RepID=UPI0012490973|nr:6-phosphogluconolactonase [Synechococcus sp. RSCCF101]QEY31625.1 6-phosphogluconolactonase [Synechococcus sp. RSCCF101]
MTAPSSSGYRVVRASSSEDLARRAAETIASHIDLALDQRDRAQIALCGGGTPAATYRHLAQERLPWDRVDVFLGDERWVDSEDPASNARLLRQTLLAEGPGASASFHPVPTSSASPEDGARLYEEAIQRACRGAPPIFDLMLLGLGEDGHTASLFPGTAATTVRDRWVTIGEGKGLPRITLTAPVLSAAGQVIMLVAGAGKQQALQRLQDPAEPAERTPARLVQPARGVLILADEAAAGSA